MKARYTLVLLLLMSIFSMFPCLGRAQPQITEPQQIKPPQLLTPENGSIVKGNPEFFWTSATMPGGFKGKYKLKVVPVSTGQTAGAAMTVNPPVHQATMRRMQEALPADAPALKNGQTYAWRVQVVDENGSPVGENNGMSEIFTFAYSQVLEAPPPVSPTPGAGSITISTAPLQMTGMRISSITIDTPPLQMTGIRVNSITVNTAPLQMTGIRGNSISINTAPLQMTGMRVEPITIKTAPLQMTGMRDEEPDQPLEGKNTKIKRTGEKELDQKLELPPQKTEKKVMPKEPGKTIDKTGDNKLPGETPDLKPVQQSLPEGVTKSVDKTVSTPLKQKLEGLKDTNVQKGIEPTDIKKGTATGGK